MENESRTGGRVFGKRELDFSSEHKNWEERYRLTQKEPWAMDARLTNESYEFSEKLFSQVDKPSQKEFIEM